MSEVEQVKTDGDVSEETPLDPNACPECRFDINSEQHIRGEGLHGHERTSKAEADSQRRAVLRQAREEAEARAKEDRDAFLASLPVSVLEAAVKARKGN